MMKLKTYLWLNIFSLLFLLFFVRTVFSAQADSLLLIVGVVNYGLLVFSRRKSVLSLFHGLIAILLITLIFVSGARSTELTLSYLFAVLFLVVCVVSIDREDKTGRLPEISEEIENDLEVARVIEPEQALSEESKEESFFSEPKKPVQEAKAAEKPGKTEKPEKPAQKQKPAVYVAGKFSSQYHTESCSVAKRLSRKRTYESKEKAETAGLKPHDCVTS
ncbi:MAG TPA: hypothetical protein ENN46_03615 [Candidatus Woesearchaeota archaeon]|nr:hypothetical protein [Candidatus Woesearchaeota archaeon]